MSFANKVVIVTGASSGIGASTAYLFAQEGASVAIVGRNEKNLKEAAEKIAKVGKQPLSIVADVSVDDDAKRIVQETIDKFGKLDVLVNNAGLARYGGILEGKILECYDTCFSINVRAVINLTTLAAPHLVKSKGCIVNVSSTAGLAMPKAKGGIAYSTSKAALDYFTKSAAAELSSSGIRVNSVNPGPTETSFLDNAGRKDTWEEIKHVTALQRVSKPDEIAKMIMYLSGENAVGITGSIFVIDNGILLK